jgi:anti-sigma factor RsiW
MRCAKFEPLIALYVENDLAEAEARAVESHLETCESCREFVIGMRESQAALKGLRAELVEDSVFADVRREVMDDISRPRKMAAWPRYAVAAMLVAGLVAGWLWRSPRGTTLDFEPVAAVIPSPSVVPAIAAPEPRRAIHRRRQRPRLAPRFKSEPLVVKMMTDDPQIVIYWLVDQNGG